jgi:hypothetical protein
MATPAEITLAAIRNDADYIAVLDALLGGAHDIRISYDLADSDAMYRLACAYERVSADLDAIVNDEGDPDAALYASVDRAYDMHVADTLAAAGCGVVA